MKHLLTTRNNPLAALLVSAALGVPATAQSTLDIAIIGEADTFDPMVSTKDVVSIVAQHFVETLFTFDESWAVARC